MMFSIDTRGANQAYAMLARTVLDRGQEVTQRGLTTKEIHPAIVHLQRPRERLVTSYGRPVNVAFALAEVLWILAGRQDVEMLAAYNSKIHEFSDDGKIFNAAYGYRMRHAQAYDQLEDAEAVLRKDPGSRQATITIWSSLDRGFYHVQRDDGNGTYHETVQNDTKDRACNVLAHPMIRNGKLDWLQIIRSNDLIWGTPYNWMQWTHVQEYLAERLEIPVGTYTHVADSLHVYDWHYDDLQWIENFDIYHMLSWQHRPMGRLHPLDLQLLQDIEKSIRNFHIEAPIHLDDNLKYWESVLDILSAHQQYKRNRDETAYSTLMRIYDRVYAAAQIRFYVSHRWKHNEAIMERIDQDFHPDMAHWIKWHKPEKKDG